MPPIKGRMFNLQRPVAPIHCFKSAFAGRRHLRPKNITIGKQTAERALKKLRIPESLCKSLPSVRRFKDREAEITESSTASPIDPSPVIILDDDDESLTSSKNNLNLNFKKPKNAGYNVKQMLEAKFGAMIWDVAFIPSGGIVISHANGALLCDDELAIKQVLENVRLGGGIAMFPDGRIAVVCRFNDTINIFSPLGIFQISFPVSGSPASIAVNSQCEIIVCDIGEKCVRFANEDGKILRTVLSAVNGSYKLQWPEYVLVLPDDCILVCDVHQQRVFRFSANGHFQEQLLLRTVGNQEVLRPHGLCTGPGDSFFVVDSATDCIEMFTKKGRYVQNIFGVDEGRQLKAKVVRVDSANRRMLVGGLTGTVKLLRFLDKEESAIVVNTKVDIVNGIKLSVKQTVLKKEPKIPMKIEVDDVIVLD